MQESNTRLAILTSSLGGGGAQRSMVRLAGGMAARGYDVDMVLVRAEGAYREELSSAVRVVGLGTGHALAALPRLVRYLKEERPAAMLTSLNYMNIIGLWARRFAGSPRRLVVNEQNNLSSAIAGRKGKWRTRMRPILIRRFYPWADAITVVSRGVGDDLVHVTGLRPESIQVAFNPVITPKLKEMAAEPIEHPWLRPGEPPVIVALGRLVPQKDFGTLIEAFAKVSRQRPARLMILGEGAERAALEALVARHGLGSHVTLPGWVVNPYPLLMRSQLFVLSSRWEGLPTVLIEALFCGLPVVATDCPSGPDEILEGGRYGALVPVGNVDALAAAILRALAGETPRPTPDSWRPYELDVLVDHHLKILLG